MSANRIRDFDYSNDRLIIADMDARSKSFVFKITKAINGLGDEIDKIKASHVLHVKNLESRIEALEKAQADKTKSDESLDRG